MLEVRDVVKRYGKVTAVNHVSFTAQPGRILGLLGPNGAGKTSTIRMITYITTPDEGEVLFERQRVGPWSQRRMGYLPEEKGLYKKMKVEEQLTYLARLKGLDRHEAKEQITYWLDRFGASDWRGKKTEELSKGMQQKVQFIATILHNPSLLILDEPFGGLDPINSELLREIILELRDSGRLKGLDRHEAKQQITYWLDRFGASDWRGKKTEELSKGMQQKVQFIATILHNPSLLILDEPFGGLDPINSELLREIILELRDSGRIILFASHRMEQVEQMCDDICLVSRGRIVLDGPLRTVKRRFGRDAVTITFEGRDDFLKQLVAEGSIKIGTHSRNRAEVRLLNGTPARRVLEAALTSVDEVHSFQVAEPPLNEIFVSVVGEEEARAALDSTAS